MTQTYFCGKCMKEYQTENKALNCCYEWKLQVGAIENKVIAELQDKLSRRNMQIKDLKAKLSRIQIACEMHSSNEQCVNDVWDIVAPQSKL